MHLRIFIQADIITGKNKTKTYQERQHLVSGCFIKVFYKTTTFDDHVALYRFDCNTKQI